MNHGSARALMAILLVACGLMTFTLAGAQAQPTAPAATATGTAFTYQGQLQNNGGLATGSYDFQFVLYDAAVGGSQVGGTPIVTKDAVAVTNGQFTVLLDFGNAFGSSAVFLEIGVRATGGSAAYVTLSPRQPITPAPYAQYAVRAGSASSADTAQQVPWSGVTGKPGAVTRQIIIPGNALSFAPSAQITQTQWGPQLSSSAAPIGFVVPQPADWDQTRPFTVTVNFALPTAPSAATVNWRLNAGSTNLNLPPDQANNGWDSLDFSQSRDAGPLSFGAAPSRTNLMKSQSWVAQYSSAFSTWYLGTSVTTNNDFSNDPLWRFSFQRGAAVSNDESYSGGLIVVNATVSYVSK